MDKNEENTTYDYTQLSYERLLDVIKLSVKIRGNGKYFATERQIAYLVKMGCPLNEALLYTPEMAQYCINEHQRNKNVTMARWKAIEDTGNKEYCECPHCLGHPKE